MEQSKLPNDAKVAIVTGAASGIGLGISRKLADYGMTVVMADIEHDKCQKMAAELYSHGCNVSASRIDLADPLSIQCFVKRFQNEFDCLHLLVNNAGVMMPAIAKTPNGQEPHWAINHLGHFSLTTRLLSTLASTPGSRVVTQSSIVHDSARIDFHGTDACISPKPWEAYKQSKLATLLFSLELQRRLSKYGIFNPISVACHPGLVWTPLYRNSRAFGMLLRPFMHRIDSGVEPAILAATDPQTKGGDFYGPIGWRGFKGPAGKVCPLGKGTDSVLASNVWSYSKNMTGLDPDIELLRIAEEQTGSI